MTMWAVRSSLGRSAVLSRSASEAVLGAFRCRDSLRSSADSAPLRLSDLKPRARRPFPLARSPLLVPPVGLFLESVKSVDNSPRLVAAMPRWAIIYVPIGTFRRSQI